MLKSLVLAGLIAIGTTASAFAEGSSTDLLAVSASAGDRPSEQGCHDASKPWLPGTLQIDERTQPPIQAEPDPLFERAPVITGCALV